MHRYSRVLRAGVASLNPRRYVMTFEDLSVGLVAFFGFLILLRVLWWAGGQETDATTFKDTES